MILLYESKFRRIYSRVRKKSLVKYEERGMDMSLPASLSLKGLFTSFEYITFFRVSTKETFFIKRFISIKQL